MATGTPPLKQRFSEKFKKRKICREKRILFIIERNFKIRGRAAGRKKQSKITKNTSNYRRNVVI